MPEMTSCDKRLQPRDRYDTWHPRKCDRAAVATITEGLREVRVCSLHLKAHERTQEKDRQFDQEYKEERRQDAARRDFWTLMGYPAGIEPRWTDALVRLQALLKERGVTPPA